MAAPKLIISPKTKVGELLDAFPQLENTLLDISPAFAKLKNPILRKTVARVASLQQAAMIGGLKVEELVNRLRKEVGQDVLHDVVENTAYIANEAPDWFKSVAVAKHFDASPFINSGGSPMAEILSITNKLQKGEILELKTPFVPAPIIGMLKDKGLQTFSLRRGGEVLTYFLKT
jgi:hypothetical protein